MPTTTRPFKTLLATPGKQALRRKKPVKPSTAKTDKKYPRKRCENCGDLFDKKRKNQRFCPKQNGACRKEFFRYGAAYGPIKMGLHNAIDKKCAALMNQLREIVDCVARLEVRIVHVERKIADAKAATD